MFKHILVPLDGSGLSEAALPAASWLAQHLKASITLIHVIEENAPKEIHGEPHIRDQQQAETYLETISQKSFPKEVQVDYHIHPESVKSVAKSIVEHQGEFDHDLIVMCTHGHGRALHLLLGSIAQEVINAGAIPVLIVHPDAEKAVESFACRSILLPVDGNEEHEQAIPIAKDLAVACDHADLHLLTIVETFTTLSGRWTTTSKLLPGTTSKILDLAEQNAEEYLSALVENFIDSKLAVSTTVLRGDPASSIAKAASKLGVDLIIMGSHGKIRLEAFWAGSVANKICSQCKIPMLLVPVSSDATE